VRALPDYLATGIDISEFNGDVDIAAMKGQVDFVIIRCGYGSDYESQDDSQYRANVRKCQQAGIPFGVYLYSYARNREMALSEARHTLRLLQGLTPLYGVWYDVEDRTLPTGEALMEDCLAYCAEIERAGYYCGLYSNLNWMRTQLNSPKLDHLDRWVAQWSDELSYPGAGMWQYTNQGVINGKRFDLDRAYRDYPAIIREGGWTDMTRDQVAELARQEAQAIYTQNETKYKTFDQVPDWARADAEEVYRRLKLGGTGSSEGKIRINASATYVRVLYVLDKLIKMMDQEIAEAREEAGE